MFSYKSSPALAVFLIAIAIFNSSLVSAADTEVADSEQEDTTDESSDAGFFSSLFGTKPWSPPAPKTDDFDWIQLKSGEWLKGEIKAMYSGTLEFDSEELDLQEFDWMDIKQVRTGKRFSVRVGSDVVYNGAVVLKDGTITVTDKEGEKVSHMDNVISIAPGEPKELNNWSARVSLGANFRSGNVDQSDVTSRITLQRRTTKNRFYLDFQSNYGETNGIDTANDYRVNSYWDIFKTKKFFIRAANLEYFRDSFQNIANKFTLSASAGYHIISNHKTEWDITGGPGFTFTEFDEVAAGEPRSTNSPSAIISTNFDTPLTSYIDLSGDYRATYNNVDAGGITYHAQTTFEFELTHRLDLDISLIWDRISNPVSTDGNNTPEKDDFKLTIGIGMNM